MLFLRLTIMVLFLTPLFLSKAKLFINYANQLIVLGLFFVGNLVFFILGINTGTALVSGTLYASVPITVLFLSSVFNKERLSRSKITSIMLGLTGSLIILYSAHGLGQLRNFEGAFLLFLATVSYACYLVYSKHLSFHLSPLELTSATAAVGWIVAGLAMLFDEGLSPLLRVTQLSLSGWFSLAYLGVFLGFVMYFLIQWGVKHSLAVLAASMQYVGLVFTGASGVILLGERLTGLFLLGSAFVITGLYLLTFHPFIRPKLVK